MKLIKITDELYVNPDEIDSLSSDRRGNCFIYFRSAREEMTKLPVYEVAAILKQDEKEEKPPIVFDGDLPCLKT